jgi:hypothetical protein
MQKALSATQTGRSRIPRQEPGGERLADSLDKHLTSRGEMIIQMPDPKMRHLDMADEDWDMAMEDLFDTLRKLPPEHRAQAYDVVERCLFKGQNDA